MKIATEIENLDNLLIQYNSKTQKIVGQKVTRLTAPGENYGSVMLAVDITLVNPDETEEIVKAVAKTVPPNDYIQAVFNTKITFKNEIHFYKTIVPTLRDFQKEEKVAVIDFVSNYLGSRFSLDVNKTEIDNDAVLLMENLKVGGFVNLNRTDGFGYEVTENVLGKLAHFHATALALKLKKRDIFEKKIKPYLHPYSIDKQHLSHILATTLKEIDKIEDVKPYLNRVKENFYIKPFSTPSRELFSTISHNDLWINNIMLKISNNPSNIETKFVDFQIFDYASISRDVLFFLFSSVKSDLLAKKYDFFITFYYETFLSALNDFKCDTKSFTFDAFLDDLDYEARNSQVFHVLFMLFPIFAPEGSVKDIDEQGPDNYSPVERTEDYKHKLRMVLLEFVKRNWI